MPYHSNLERTALCKKLSGKLGLFKYLLSVCLFLCLFGSHLYSLTVGICAPVAGCRFVFILVRKQTKKGCFKRCVWGGVSPVVENRSRCNTSLTNSIIIPTFRHGFTPLVKSEFIGVYYLLVITVIIVFTILDSVEITLFILRFK